MNHPHPTPLLNWPLLPGLFVAYAFGGLNTGYYLVRWKTGQDIRAHGSGNAGARNVGRLLGPWGFGVTLLGDLLKGALPLLGATLLGCSNLDCLLVLLAVTVGHNWPAHLGFRGGKGLATSCGALLVYDPLLACALLAIFLIGVATTRRLILSATLPYAVSPALVLLCGHGVATTALFAVLACVVALPHRRNLRGELTPRPRAKQS